MNVLYILFSYAYHTAFSLLSFLAVWAAFFQTISRLTNGLWDCCKQIRAINTQDMGNNQEARRLDKRRKCGQYVDT